MGIFFEYYNGHSFQNLRWLLGHGQQAKGRLFRRKDDKYLLYIPVYLAEDSMFPFKANPSVRVKVSFKVGDKKLSIEKWEEETEA